MKRDPPARPILRSLPLLIFFTFMYSYEKSLLPFHMIGGLEIMRAIFLRKSTWICNCLHRIIMDNYLKPYNSLQIIGFWQYFKSCSGVTQNTRYRAGYDCKLYLMVLFTNPSARAGYDTRSIFKRSLTGLNSEFPFS